ncbi:hypothetical protein Tco_1266631, partial [Tanacetum coccineum]
LIDLAKEDDCLLAVSLRDDIEGVRLSGAGCFAQWLDNVTMLSEMNKLQHIDLAKEDDCLLPVSLRDDIEVYKEISENITIRKRKSLKEDSGSFNGKVVTAMETKKDESNQWKASSTCGREKLRLDSAFFTNEGLLNTEEMCIINKGLTKADSSQESFGTRKDVPSHVQCEGVGSRRRSILRKSVDWDTAFTSEGLLNFEELCMVNDGFKKAESRQSSTKRSSTESDGLHLRTLESKEVTKQESLYKSTSLTTETNSKVQHSDKSSSSPYASPASSSHGDLSPSNFQHPPRHPPCRNSSERKFTSQDVTRSSIRNVMPSGLRMPSPRIGFFDDVGYAILGPPVQLNFKGNMQRLNEFPSVKGRPGFLHKAYGIVPSTLVQESYIQSANSTRPTTTSFLLAAAIIR